MATLWQRFGRPEKGGNSEASETQVVLVEDLQNCTCEAYPHFTPAACFLSFPLLVTLSPQWLQQHQPQARSSISEWAIWKMRKWLQRRTGQCSGMPRRCVVLLGIASYYQCFVKDFLTIAWPLHRLAEKGKDFQWQESVRRSTWESSGN